MRRNQFDTKWFLVSMVASSVAWADAPMSEQSTSNVEPTALTQEKVAMIPAVGVTGYKDSAGNSASRLSEAILLQMNALTSFSQNPTEWYVGPSTGLVYTYLNGSGANWFGTSPTNTQSGGASSLIIPANLKVGYAFYDRARVSLRAGGNVMYRSVAMQMQVGKSSSTSTDSDWTIYPNVGADLEMQVSRAVSVMVRPDYTIAVGNGVLSAFAGVTIALL